MVSYLKRIAAALLLLAIPSVVSAASFETVNSNAALKALQSGQVHTVLRLGFTSPGDGGDSFFTWSSGACVTSGGTGDNGTEVKPTTGSGCWKTLTPNGRLTQYMFGWSSSLATYVSPTGSDTNNYCVISSYPCATGQHAVDVIADFVQPPSVIVNFATGSYSVGLTVDGDVIKSHVTIQGQGSVGNTTINDTETTVCTAVTGRNGAKISITAIRLSTTCAGGSDFWLITRAYGNIGNDVAFGAAPVAKIFAQGNSTMEASGGSTLLSMDGNSEFGVLVQDGSTVRFFAQVGSHIVLTGTPGFTVAFADCINGGVIKTGGVDYTGAATGSRYGLGANCSIDTEQNVNPLPGNLPGSLTGSSTYYAEPDLCIGGPSCSYTTLPTGLGTGGTAAANVGSNDYQGHITLSAGSSAGTTGVVFAIPYSVMSGCVASFGTGTGAWQPAASLTLTFGAFSGITGMELVWNNGGVALTNGSTYVLNYVCH